jgi:hypothetical protein
MTYKRENENSGFLNSEGNQLRSGKMEHLKLVFIRPDTDIFDVKFTDY